MTLSPPLRLTAASPTPGTAATSVLSARRVGLIASTLVALTPSVGVIAPVPTHAPLGVTCVGHIGHFSNVPGLFRVRSVPSQWLLRAPEGFPGHFIISAGPPVISYRVVIQCCHVPAVNCTEGPHPVD